MRFFCRSSVVAAAAVVVISFQCKMAWVGGWGGSGLDLWGSGWGRGDPPLDFEIEIPPYKEKNHFEWETK